MKEKNYSCFNLQLGQYSDILDYNKVLKSQSKFISNNPKYFTKYL